MSAISNSRRPRPGTRSELDMKSHSLDHLVGESERGRRNVDAQRTCSSQRFGTLASLFIEVPRWRGAYGGRATVVALEPVLIDDNRVWRRASRDGDRAQRVNAGFLLVTEPVVAVGYGCRVASTDGATHWC